MFKVSEITEGFDITLAIARNQLTLHKSAQKSYLLPHVKYFVYLNNISNPDPPSLSTHTHTLPSQPGSCLQHEGLSGGQCWRSHSPVTLPSQSGSCLQHEGLSGGQRWRLSWKVSTAWRSQWGTTLTSQQVSSRHLQGSVGERGRGIAWACRTSSI